MGVRRRANYPYPKNQEVQKPIIEPLKADRSNWRRLKQKKLDFEMGTWNVRTLMRTGALKDILLQITTYKLDIIAIQETKWTGTANLGY